ncbi:hypothetical protein FIBSPDRAFT_1052241 [Athelia psychrophila]|uniref:BTB domain-containing protein n=1 Tax=Athelia psychrophila TaxID=1759441 RepID=A0A165XP46_9AGAM|nr:hypothetical protein FIBSPDRAFT_1052237 [Fibularhizoctonia sp. CBS 109695]KZP08745.1 hypothetical protein FIBSPDRAFT_1052241 [Fibularhizoctonia sp. CBS 109695]
MSSDSTKLVNPISPVFFINSKANVIVRSSDDIDFYVSRYLLSYASPVFEGMFSIPSPPNPEDSDETKDGLPVLKLAEDSRILERILLLCYPMNLVEDVFVRDMEDAASLLLALEKYNMVDSGKRLRRLLLESPFLRADPMHAFAVGSRLKHTEIMKLAARYLSDDIFDHPHHENPDYENFTYLQLVKGRNYRKKCAQAVRTAVKEMEIKGDALFAFTSGDKHKDTCRHKIGSHMWFNWWPTYFFRVKEALEKNPCGPAAMDSSHRVAVMNKITEAGCATCSAMVVRDLPRFSAAFSECIEEEIAKVELDMGW